MSKINKSVNTYILGKDESLENSIKKMLSISKNLGINIKEVSWLNPATNIYSVHICDSVNPNLFSNGKGSTKKSALASALGEFYERLETNYFFADYYLTPDLQSLDLQNQNQNQNQNLNNQDWLYYPNEKTFSLSDYKNCLTPELWQVYNPENLLKAEHLLSLNDNSYKIHCLPLKELSSENIVYFPVNLLNNLYASNGLSAGNTQAETQVQAISEVLERWVKNKVLKENICLPKIPSSTISKYPSIEKSIKHLLELGINVSVRDASLGGVYPVICIILFDPTNGTCFASFGSHPLLEVALERTLTESMQGRKLNELDGFQIPIFDENEVASDENIENHFIDSSGLLHAKFISDNPDFNYKSWNFDGDTLTQRSKLIEIINNLGYKIYIAEYQNYGMCACRVVVPKMSEIYPIDELIYNNQNEGRKLRDIIQSLSLKNPDYSNLFFSFEKLGFSDHQNIANIIGLQPDDNSDWLNFKVIDFKMWLLLADKNYETVLDIIEYNILLTDNVSTKIFYNCLLFLLKIKTNNMENVLNESSLINLFGKNNIKKAIFCIEGKIIFNNLNINKSVFLQSKKHKNLLKIYKHVSKFKK